DLDHRVPPESIETVGAMLGRIETAVFSKCAVLRTSIGAQDAGRNQRVLRSRREPHAVSGRRHAVAAGEAGRERADALEADGEADVGNRAVRRAHEAPRRAPAAE